MNDSVSMALRAFSNVKVLERKTIRTVSGDLVSPSPEWVKPLDMTPFSMLPGYLYSRGWENPFFPGEDFVHLSYELNGVKLYGFSCSEVYLNGEKVSFQLWILDQKFHISDYSARKNIPGTLTVDQVLAEYCRLRDEEELPYGDIIFRRVEEVKK